MVPSSCPHLANTGNYTNYNKELENDHQPALGKTDLNDAPRSVGALNKGAGSTSRTNLMKGFYEIPLINALEDFHLRGQPVLDKLIGLGAEALISGTNYDFINQHLRPKPLATFWAGGKGFLYLADPADINAVSAKIKFMTQSGKENPENGTFGALATVFGETNILETDSYEEGNGKLYRQELSVIQGTTGNPSKMRSLYTDAMNKIIHAHLREISESATGKNLTESTHSLAMRIGAKALLNADYIEPTDLIKEDPSILPLYKDLTPKYASNRTVLPKIIQPLVGCPHADPKEDGDKIADSQLKMLAANYPAIARDPKSTLKLKWETDRFFGKGKNALEPFPHTFEGFKEAMNSSEENYKKCHALLRDQGFMQVVSSETTAQGMNFAIRELLNHPEYVEKIRDEITKLEAGAEGITFEDVTPKEMSELPYLSSFVMEVLRLYPPAPLMRWEAKGDHLTGKDHFTVALQGKEVKIKKGLYIAFDVEMANRKAYENGDQFEPQRWLKDPTFDFEKTLNDLKYGSDMFRTFAGGPRACPGRLMASMEIAKLAGFIARDWKLSTEKLPVSMERGGLQTLRPTEEGTRILLAKRGVDGTQALLVDSHLDF